MVLRNRPSKFGKLEPLEFTQVEVIGRPVINVTVWGDNLEDFDESIAFEVYHRASGGNGDLMKWAIPRLVWVDVPITLEPGQPNPTRVSNQLEVVQTAVPTIKHQALRRKSPFLGSREHGTEMVVLGCSIDALLVKPIVQRDMTVAFCPQQGNQVDALHYPLRKSPTSGV